MKQDQLIKTMVQILTSFSPDTGRVIIFSGEWGSGKTYIFKNEIIKKIKSDKSFEIIYVSLFGVSSVIELKSKINQALLVSGITEFSPKIVKEVIRKLKPLGRIFRSIKGNPQNIIGTVTGKNIPSISFDLLNLIDKKIILCFDDFERSSKNFDANELIGFLNELVEHRKHQVLIIANEDKLLDVKEEEKNRYLDNKEKLRAITFRHNPNTKEVFDRIFDSHLDQLNEGARNFLEKNRDVISDLFIQHGKKNFRTLIKLIQAITDLAKLADQELPEKSLYFLCSTLLEESLYNEKNEGFYNFNSDSLSLILYTSKDKDTFTDEERAHYELASRRQEFLSRFYSNHKEYQFYPELFNFVKNRNLDPTKLQEELAAKVEEKTKIDEYFESINSNERLIFFMNEPNINSLINFCENYFKDGGFKTYWELVTCVRYYFVSKVAFFKEGVSAEVRNNILGHIPELLKCEENMGDIDTHPFLHRDLDEPMIKEMQKLIEEEKKRRACFIVDNLFLGQTGGDVVEEIRSKPSVAETLLDNQNLDRLKGLAKSDPESHHRILEELLASTPGRVNNQKLISQEALDRLDSYVFECAASNDKMIKYRANQFLTKFPRLKENETISS